MRRHYNSKLYGHLFIFTIHADGQSGSAGRNPGRGFSGTIHGCPSRLAAKISRAKNNALALFFALPMHTGAHQCSGMVNTCSPLILGDQCPDGREYIYDSINDKDNDRPDFQGQGVEKLQAEIKGNRGAQQVALHHDVFPETRVGRTMFDTAFSQSDDGVEYRGDLQKHP